jgi:hypothetical protein
MDVLASKERSDAYCAGVREQVQTGLSRSFKANRFEVQRQIIQLNVPQPSGGCVPKTRLAIEKAVMLPKKAAQLAAAGVLCLMRRMGITGYELQAASTNTNAGHSTALAPNRPSTSGDVQASSSLVLSENARRSVATAPTSVKEPSQSILVRFKLMGNMTKGKGHEPLELGSYRFVCYCVRKLNVDLEDDDNR